MVTTVVMRNTLSQTGLSGCTAESVWLKHAVVDALQEIVMINGNSGLYSTTVTSPVLFLVGVAESPKVKTHQLMTVQMY